MREDISWTEQLWSPQSHLPYSCPSGHRHRAWGTRKTMAAIWPTSRASRVPTCRVIVHTRARWRQTWHDALWCSARRRHNIRRLPKSLGMDAQDFPSLWCDLLPPLGPDFGALWLSYLVKIWQLINIQYHHLKYFLILFLWVLIII